MQRMVMLVLLGSGSAVALTSPYPQNRYDYKAAQDYFRGRPLEVAGRALELATLSAGFGASLLGDLASGKLEENADMRALDLVDLLTRLGPTFIKAGQSASIRTDLLPPAYITGLTALQDRVPPFSNDEARALIKQELGKDASVAFTSLSNEPVAAASLGQVYKGQLPDGTEVAVKCQRPGMVNRIALDMHLIRDYAVPLAKLVGLPGDLVGTADAWGTGFVDELNYLDEKDNAERFNDNVQNSNLAGRVFAPPVIAECSSQRVLTTQWVDGERLDRCSAPEDVPRLCSLAMNIYLEMMLAPPGVLHCDPHPGNLLRTADGKLCILDWGLVTTVRPDLQLTLIEHVAHLTASDYAKVPSDLVKLGFVPDGAEKSVIDNGVADFLTETYSTWKSGGGASKLDVPKLFAEVRELASDTPDGLFQVPPYFAYIAKSFSVLEGIGLSADPNYSIVDETLPYISQRIISDPSPRTAGALETFLFGDAKDDRDTRVLDADRVATLVDGAKRYTESLSVTDGAAGASTMAMLAPAEAAPLVAAGPPAVDQTAADSEGVSPGSASLGASTNLDAATDAILDLLLTQDASPLQEIAIEQSALLLGAVSRERFAELRKLSGTAQSGPGSGRSRLGLLLDPLGFFKGSALVDNDERDRQALEAAAKLAELADELLPAGLIGSASGDAPTATRLPGSQLLTQPELRDLSSKLVTKVWARREELRVVSRRLAVKLLDQTSQRAFRRSTGQSSS